MASKKELVEDEIRLVSKASTKKNRNRSILWLIQGAILLVLIVAALYILFVYIENSQNDAYCPGGLQVDYVRRKIYVSDNKNASRYFGRIGKNLNENLFEKKSVENGFEFQWENGPKLVVEKTPDDANCTSVHWSKMEGIDSYPIDCFTLSGINWYGGAELYQQVWPFENTTVEMAAYYPQDTLNAYYEDYPAFGPVMGRYWVTSIGAALIVNQTSPLVVGVNAKDHKGWLCLTIDPNQYPATNIPPELRYTICADKDVKAVHQGMIKKFFKKPTKGPDKKMIQYPVWSTWVKYHSEVNQNDVEQFVEQISSNNFSCSQIEIDDKYTTKYGDYDFDPMKFPDPKGMIEKIHNASCRVTTWVHPFAELDSKVYAEGKILQNFVVGGDGKTPGILKWWNGYAVAVDVTKPSAYDWFLNRLKTFQNDYNIDSFKFDAGSVTYLPFEYTLNGTDIPSDYCVKYAELASDINSMVEVRVADHSQDLPLFVRFLDRDASWDSALGLTSVIPTVLTFGILGYPFILPDMIGGNGDPDKELFTRWMQLNAFLPSMQFSHAPWDFDNETIEIAHHMLDIRANILPTLLEGVDNAVSTGEPIIRPLWWIAPDDPVALTIDQQFMVTNVYLVAPVVTAGATNISIYLPKGDWLEQFGKKNNFSVTEGTTVVYKITSLDDVFYFKNLALEHK